MIRKMMFFLAACSLLNASGAAEPDRNRALRQYIQAVKITDPAQRAMELLKVLKLDPSDCASLQMLLAMRKQYEQAAPLITSGLLLVANEHPEAPELGLAAFLAAADTSPVEAEQGVALAGKIVHAVPHPQSLSPAARTAYMKLLAVHITRLQKTGQTRQADDLLEKLKTGMPEPDAVTLTELQGLLRARMIFQVPDTRRWCGLRQSERAEWREKLQQSLETIRQTDHNLLELKDFEHRVNLYIRLRSFADALRTAELAVTKLPEEPGAQYLRITARMRTRHYPEAYDAAKKFAQAMPDNPAALRLLADTALRCGDYATAEDAGKRMEDARMPEGNGDFFIVTALVMQKKYPEAEKKIRTIQDDGLRTVLELMLQNRRGTGSAKLLKRLKKLEANPKYKGGDAVYTQMLTIAEQTRDAALLEYCWKKLAELDALKDPENANNVGYTAAVMGIRLEEARKLIESAVAAQPENGAYLDSMAWVCHQQQHYEEAWEYIQRALAVPDDDFTLGVVLDHAGDIAVKLDRPDAALGYYRQALGDYLSMELDQSAVKAKIEQLEKKLNTGVQK